MVEADEEEVLGVAPPLIENGRRRAIFFVWLAEAKPPR